MERQEGSGTLDALQGVAAGGVGQDVVRVPVQDRAVVRDRLVVLFEVLGGQPTTTGGTGQTATEEMDGGFDPHPPPQRGGGG